MKEVYYFYANDKLHGSFQRVFFFLWNVKNWIHIFLLMVFYQASPAQDSIRIHKNGFKTYPPYLNAAQQPVLRNQHAPFGRKFIRATGFVLATEACEMAILLLSSEGFSKWDKSQFSNLRQHYKDAFTKPPIIDKDTWYNDYIGHPYQGAFDYNALRSQGGTVWQSGLFVALHSTVWEYLIEGSQERPSIQDLILTPVGGVLLGELFNFTTMRLSRNGFTWYEALVVCVINPAFVLNNGFKFAHPKYYKRVE